VTTTSFNHAAANFYDPRAPRMSFAARLAALQAAQDHSPHLTTLFGAAARAAAAAIPVCALAYLFVFV